MRRKAVSSAEREYSRSARREVMTRRFDGLFTALSETVEEIEENQDPVALITMQRAGFLEGLAYALQDERRMLLATKMSDHLHVLEDRYASEF